MRVFDAENQEHGNNDMSKRSKNRSRAGEIVMRFVLDGFKFPVKGDWYLEENGMPKLETYACGNCGIKRPILRLKYYSSIGISPSEESVNATSVYYSQPVMDYIYTGELRLPKKGEWFCTGINSPPEQATFDYKNNRLAIMRPLSPEESKDLVFTRGKEQS